MSFDVKLLEAGILVCPKTKLPLVRDGESLVSVDPECRLRYEIKEGIPNMLIDEATRLSPAEWSAVMSRSGRDGVTGLVAK